jgi:hypothetical protein
MMKPYSNAQVIINVMCSLAVLTVMSPHVYGAQPTILSDQALMEWARDTYMRGTTGSMRPST